MMTAKKLDRVPFDLEGLRGLFSQNEPMSRHTSWRVGGPAQYFYIPADRQDVIELLKRIPNDVQIVWVGLGSNLLVRDRGIEGLVIKTAQALTKLELRNADQVYAEAGVSCAKVARFSVTHNLTGAEFLAGVPGSFGGALAMNAGAFGGETWELVNSIECVDRQGDCRLLQREEVSWSYRQVNLPDDCSLLAGVLQLKHDESNSDGKGRIKSFLEKRSASQPIQSANAGSVFKNPEGKFAAKIIEQLGLKGHKIGGASFSEMHANFIINDGGATASDIEGLIDTARSQAMERFGVVLEPEVRILGASG